MPILPRKLAWDEEIDQTDAKNSFIICRPHEFPLSQVQAIAERILNPKPSTFFSRKPVPHCSQAGDEILIDELKHVAGVLYTEEAAILSCLHLLTWDVARWHLQNKIKPDLNTADTDGIFTSRISVYLQCIVIAEKIGTGLVHEGEALAARQLLRILHHGKTKEFPSVVKLLATIADTSCEGLLPFDFLAEVLRRAEWREKLKGRLAHLRKSQRWAEAYSLVDGLQEFSERSDLPRDVRRWLPDLFSPYPMWASWRPNLSRIHTWKAGTTPEQKARLGPVFELEGPDTTPQQRSTLRHSSCGAFPNARSHGGTRNNTDILDQLLNLFDRAVHIGPNAIDLFIHLALTATSTATNPPTYNLTWHTLHQLSAAFHPGTDSTPHTLLSFLLTLHDHDHDHDHHPTNSPTPIHHRLTTLTALLPLLNASPPLQTLFGEAHDIPLRAPRTLSTAQSLFCHHLPSSHTHTPQPALPLALAILALSRALLASPWLLDRWRPAFVHMLRTIAGLSEAEIRARFGAIQSSTAAGVERQAQMDYLAVSIGGSEIRGGGQVVSSPPPAVVIEDEVWTAELDVDRHALRKRLRALGMGKGEGDMKLATRCLKEEDGGFVRGVTGYIVGGSDQVCVNLARFLAPRMGRNGGRNGDGRECWVGLCLWMMRRRPRGMLERLGADLSVESWNEWVGCLGKLFGEGYLGEKGGLGFSKERMRQITVWKMSRAARVYSGSSGSTISI